MGVILLDLFTLNYVVTLEVTGIASCFIKLSEIPWKHGNSVVMGNSAAWLKILWPAKNCGP